MIVIPHQHWPSDPVRRTTPMPSSVLQSFTIDKIRYLLAESRLERLLICGLQRANAQDIGTTIKALAARRIEVIVLQLGKLDLTSAAGKLMLNMLAAVAEMERDLLVERSQSGLARAKAEGKTLGRPTSTNDEQRAAMARQHQAGESISALARTFGISRASVMRVVKPSGADATAA